MNENPCTPRCPFRLRTVCLPESPEGSLCLQRMQETQELRPGETLLSRKEGTPGIPGTFVESREGLPLTREAFCWADEILTDGVRKGQHIYHITQTHNLGMSVSTVYRNISKGYLSVRKMDLPQAVKFKQRKSHRDEYVPSAIKKGRTFSDFKDYISAHEIEEWGEMDTVIGKPGGKVIITFDFTSCNFMIGLLLNNRTAVEAAKKIQGFK